MGLHNNAPDLAVQGEMGWVLAEYKYYLSMLRLWNKIIKLDPMRITRGIIEWDLQNFNSDYWCGKIWNVFDSFNLHEVFENGEAVHLSDVKSKLNIIMQNMWCEK